ncbi:hypothetical protein [Ktedonospora formicarum]|uniref:Uncharacterized protein n=1 Tax=Ktedonospora formicarum TaxID=2778364 RepID=A0A8J3HZ08_9CHLR|nr:hypothetical protein [Ktedonospora formicarum]GHO41874.1 hypothetical protein KSX_00370 [Ktedonospora formicarum]
MSNCRFLSPWPFRSCSTIGRPSSFPSWERWYITTLAIQKLVGGRKEAINAYLETHEEEIKAHHARLEIKPSFNRKPEPITEMIHIAEEPTAFPWGHAETQEAEA